jgi:DNA-directed RNA polymerase subunit beta'
MAVHVPLSEEAQWEAKNIMSANKNILKPGSGEMIVMVQKPLDIVLGSYWLTKAWTARTAKGSTSSPRTQPSSRMSTAPSTCARRSTCCR